MERRKINPWRWSEALGFDQAVEVVGAQRILFCSGQSSVDADGKPMHVDNMLAQTVQSLDNLATVLEAAGYTPADVVRLDFFATDIDALWAVMEDFGRYAESNGWQTSSGTLMGVSRLAQPELMVEIEATAVK